MKPVKELFYAMSHGVNRGVLKKGKSDNRINFLNRLINKINNINYDFYGFEKWVEGTNMMLNLRNKFPHKFVILKYEDLLINTINVMEHLFEFCDLQFSNQTKNFIYESTPKSTNDPYDV